MKNKKQNNINMKKNNKNKNNKNTTIGTWVKSITSNPKKSGKSSSKNSSSSSSSSTSIISYNSITNNLNSFMKNNYTNIKSILLFTLALILISSIYYVYKSRSNNGSDNEGFLQQTPIDLLDRLKKNNYISRPEWSNFLYNQQPNKKENPLTFWKLQRENNQFKYIGNAVSNEVNELNGTYTPTRERTMLVQGDIRVPTDVKLLFQHPHNLITNYLFTGNNTNISILKEINTIGDIEFRLEKLKELYNSLSNARQRFDRDILNNINNKLDRVLFKTSLYNIDNYFKNPSSILVSTFNNNVKSLNGEFNCIRFPIGFKVKFTFTNGYTITLDPDINSILDYTGTKFKKINNTNVHVQKDGSPFQYANMFGILEDTGINAGNPNISNNKETHIGHKTRERLYFSFNSMVRKGKGGRHDLGYSGKGKDSLYDYANELYNNNGIRKRYLSGYDDDINENKKVYLIKINSYNDIFIQNNSVSVNDKIYRYRDPNRSNVYFKKRRTPRVGSKNTYKVQSVDKLINTDTTPTIKDQFHNVENINEGFDSGENVTSEMISNSKIHVEEEYIKFDIDFSNIFSEINTLLDDCLTTNSYTWLLDIKNHLIKLSNKNEINGNEPLNWINNIFSNSDDNANINIRNDNKIISINYPYFFIDYTFKYPQFSRSWRRRKFFLSGRKAYAYSRGRRTNVTGTMWNDGTIGGLSQVDFDGYKNTHNLKEIGDSLLKNVEISSNFTKNTFPAFIGINNFIKDNITKLGDLLNIISNMSNKLNELRTQIISNSYKHYPLRIYRPIAPKYYKSVGDIILSLDSYSNNNDRENFDKLDNVKVDLQQYACMPEQCVREVRDWLPIDKIYEYQEGNKYLAIYRNPYLQTFRAVTVPGVLPPGKVEKIVACVEKCKLVDDLIQSDKCAQTFYKANKSISDSLNLDPDNILHNKQSSIYKNKIIERENKINSLKDMARKIQMEDDKANVINKSYNRHKLQDLVDKQKMNMHKLVNKLEKGKNNVDINVKFNYDKATGTLNELCANNKLPPAVCDKLNNMLDNSARRALSLNNNDRLQYDKQTLDNLLASCPTPDMENLFKRSLVESNCGCYFTDEEIETS